MMLKVPIISLQLQLLDPHTYRPLYKESILFFFPLLNVQRNEVINPSRFGGETHGTPKVSNKQV